MDAAKFLRKVWGEDNGIGVRSAVGMGFFA